MQSPLRHNLHKRIWAIMVHTKYYGSQGQGRLARNAGVSRSTVTRFLRGESSPSVFMVLALLREIEKQLGRDVDLRELISLDGTYPTPSVCKLMGCPGCLPPDAHYPDCTTKPDYRHMKGGEWSVTPSPDPTVGEAKESIGIFSLPDEQPGNAVGAPKRSASHPLLNPSVVSRKEEP